jgi:hypothetical protein
MFKILAIIMLLRIIAGGETTIWTILAFLVLIGII